MQKKSLLVALFCGALCLTGCLKNEESASVVQVRNAKANELNSIAKLNEAKAAAEAVYAQADLTLANAEAKLKEAEANLVNAQAETEKVRAELLKVQVKLAEVKVEEEKIKLQMMEADLEARLAALEVEIAAAEAAKQGWINVLNNLVAKAEIDAVKNAQDILEAEQELEDYILTLEGQKADSAKVYAALYFQSLDSVAVYQAKYIAAKAAKVLINREALDVREYIYDEIGKNNDTIALNDARIAYLKEYQTASPEEIKAQMEEAWKEVNDAYAVYMAAVEASKEAETAMDDAAAVKSTYVEDWGKNFGTVVKDVLATTPLSAYGQYGYSEYVFVDEETGVIYNAAVKFDEDGEVEEIVPLWTASVPDMGKEQYSEEAVFPATIEGIYQQYPTIPGINLSTLSNRTYYPAAIEFDNIDDVFAAYKNWQEEVVLKEWDDDLADYIKAEKEDLEEDIEDWKTEKKDFEDYIANPTRKAMVEKAEKALEDAIAEANKTRGADRKAHEAYRDYMVTTYDVDRKYFEARYSAKEALDNADADSTSYVDSELPAAKAAVDAAFEELEKAELNAHEKAGAYEKAKKAYNDAAASATYTAAVAEAQKKSNNLFEDPIEEKDTVWVAGSLYNTDGATASDTHATKEGKKVASTKAGSAQVAYYTTKKAMEDAEKELRDAQWLASYWTGYGDATKAKTYSDKISTLESQYKDAVTAFNAASKTAVSAAKITKDVVDVQPEKKNMEDAEKVLAAAIADLYPAGVDEDPTTWDLYLEAVRDTLKANVLGVPVKLNYYPRTYGISDIPTAEIPVNEDPEEVKDEEGDYKDYTTAQKTAWFANQHRVKTAALKDAEDDLLEELARKQNVEPEDIPTTADKKADELYKAWLEAEDTGLKAMEDAFDEVQKVYGLANQDRHGPYYHPFYWTNANYQVDPEYQYISGYDWDDEEETYVIEKSYVRYSHADPEKPSLSRSLAGRIQLAEAALADEEQFAEDCKEEFIDIYGDPHEAYDAMCDRIDEATKNLAKYKAVENAYVASVKDRNTTHAAWVEAKIEELAADALYKIEREEYLALKDIANEGVWVYDPEYKIYAEVYGIENEDGEHMGEFTLVPIAKEIENLEQDNVRLEEKNEDLKQLLSDGKKALQVVNEALDEVIDTFAEAIDIWAAIANKYKALMNAYLGIVEEAVVVEEGDEE